MRMCGPPAMYPELEASTGDLPAVVMHPKLLMAIRSNQCVELENLLNGGDRPTPQTTAAAPQGVIDAGDGADEISESFPHDTEASLSSSSATPRRQSSAAVLADGVNQSASFLLKGVTVEGNSALHEVATKGSCFRCSELIYEKARHLLDAPNKRGETPLHCAAKAGNTATLCHLIDLAEEEGGSERVRTVLSKQNKTGETVLHEAIRIGSMDLVKKLLAKHPELARVPGIGTSPLYLAIFSGHKDIAEELHRTDNQLSFSGPDGQNALHIALLRDTDDLSLLRTYGAFYYRVVRRTSISLRVISSTALTFGNEDIWQQSTLNFISGFATVLAPVVRRTSISLRVISSAALTFGNEDIWQLVMSARTLRARLGIWKFGAVLVVIAYKMVGTLWPYTIIFGLLLVLKIHSPSNLVVSSESLRIIQ